MDDWSSEDFHFSCWAAWVCEIFSSMTLGGVKWGWARTNDNFIMNEKNITLFPSWCFIGLWSWSPKNDDEISSQLRSVLTNCCYFLLCKQSFWKEMESFQISDRNLFSSCRGLISFHISLLFLISFTPTQSHTLSMCRKFQFLCCSFSYHHLQLFIFIHLHVRAELMSSRGKKLTMKSPQDNLHLFMMIFSQSPIPPNFLLWPSTDHQDRSKKISFREMKTS